MKHLIYLSSLAVAYLMLVIVSGCGSGPDNSGNEEQSKQKADSVEAAMEDGKPAETTKNLNSGLYKAPVKSKDNITESYTVKASADTTISYKTGTEIHVPENAFLDNDGNVVKGDVNLEYKELHSPIDFYAEGVPMDYESGGEQYAFKSGGMCKVEAYKDGRSLKVNPNAKIKVKMQSFVKGDDFNVYQLNEKSGKWSKTGNEQLKTTSLKEAQANLPLKPEKPRKADANAIEVKAPDAYPEGFKKVGDKFTMKLNKKATDPVIKKLPQFRGGREALYSYLSDEVAYPESSVHYHNKSGFVEVGLYVNKNGRVEYANPVEGMYSIFGDSCLSEVVRVIKEMPDWKPAISENGDPVRTYVTLGFSFGDGEVASFVDTITNAYMEDYREVYFQPVNPSECERYTDPPSSEINKGERPGTYELLTYDNMFRGGKPKKCLCAMAFKDDTAYSKAMQNFKKNYQATLNKRKKAEQNFEKSWDDYQAQVSKMNYPGLNVSKSQKIRRVFSLNEFGYTNIDKPEDYPQGAHLLARYRDKNGDPLYFKQEVVLAEKNENILYRYKDEIHFNPEKENILWGITEDGKLAYLKPEDFEKINKTSGSYTFTMNIYDGKLESKADIKKVLL